MIHEINELDFYDEALCVLHALEHFQTRLPAPYDLKGSPNLYSLVPDFIEALMLYLDFYRRITGVNYDIDWGYAVWGTFNGEEDPSQ